MRFYSLIFLLLTNLLLTTNYSSLSIQKLTYNYFEDCLIINFILANVYNSGIEAEAVMLGQSISMLLPEVIGYKIVGSLNQYATSTDLVLTITKVCICFVHFVDGLCMIFNSLYLYFECSICVKLELLENLLNSSVVECPHCPSLIVPPSVTCVRNMVLLSASSQLTSTHSPISNKQVS